MNAVFDHMASTYDVAFTQSSIGKLQRSCVWNYLENILPQLPGMNVLEFNCGTGEDALLFGEKGFTILATDISEEMLRITKQKTMISGLQSKISSEVFDLNTFTKTSFDKKFDLIFSNFGGLNCIDSSAFKQVLKELPSSLTPGGRFVAVVMAKYCLWEFLYFTLKLQFKKAFRRWTNKEVVALLEDVPSKTWYYNPSSLKKWSSQHFEIVNVVPVGISLPPSYLENFFANKLSWLHRLDTIEQSLAQKQWLAPFSDHYIIDFKVK